jgi:hypothetical protein
MTPAGSVLRLGWLIAALATGAASVGLLADGGPGPWTFLSARGQPVRISGRGLYRYDSVFTDAGNRGVDVVTLMLGVPLLVYSLAHYRRGSPRGPLLLAACLGYFLYVYTSMALGTAWNPLFLVYVALMSASLFALVSLLGGQELRQRARHLFAGAPRRGPAVFLVVSGLVTAGVWLAPVVAGLVQGQPPALLDHATTLITYALDLAVIVPATLIAGVLIWRRDACGYLYALPLLGLVVLLAPVLAASTASQIAAGIHFTRGQVIGPIASFVLLGAFASWVLASVLRQPGGAS